MRGCALRGHASSWHPAHNTLVLCACLLLTSLSGWTAFGGPAAHIAMFQKLFVDKLRWCTYLVFTELLMLGQCMPGACIMFAAQGTACRRTFRLDLLACLLAWLAAVCAMLALRCHAASDLCRLAAALAGPTSTQMGFALGVLKKGLSGGLLSGVLFQGPGFLILAILGWVASKVLDKPPEWLLSVVSGLAAAGVALVASAAMGLVKNICKDRLAQVRVGFMGPRSGGRHTQL